MIEVEILYNEESDTLIMWNSSSYSLAKKEYYKNTVRVDFDIYNKPILLEIKEASIAFQIPKRILRELTEKRIC